MNRLFAVALLCAAAVTPLLAQSPASAPAAPYAPSSSTLSSLFGRYAITADFAAKDPKEWGGTTTWLAADGIGKQKVAGDNASQDAFNRPNAVAFGPGGQVFVSDGYGNQRVVEFTPEGKFVRVFGGRKGKGDGEMAMVHGVAVDAQGRVYATDSDNQRVLVFDAQGKFLKKIAIPGRGGSFMAADGTFYISDVNSGAVAVMKNDQIVDVIKVEGRPHGLAVDPMTGDVYTSSTVATRPGVTKATLRRNTSTN